VPAAFCPTSADQRGEPRPDYGKPFCDVGAFELQGPLVAPAITSDATATFQVGKAGSFTVTATGVPAPALSMTGVLPSGVGFTDNGDGTASLSGMPAAGAEGSYPIAIAAENEVPPDATQSFTLTIAAPEPPDDPAQPPGGPGEPPPPPPLPPRPPEINLALGVERKSLRKLVRTGKLVVAARVNGAARVALIGRAKLEVRAHRRGRTRLVAVFKPKTVLFAEAGRKRVRLTLSRKGRRALRGLRRVRLVIAGKATDAAGKTATKTVSWTATTSSRPGVVVSSILREQSPQSAIIPEPPPGLPASPIDLHIAPTGFRFER
jgi:hypothetical protein